MPVVKVNGVANPMQFPDDMDINDIRAFLQKRFAQRAIEGESDILAPRPDTIEPYEPSLVEKAGQGIASALTESGIISDNYGAQRIGKNLSALGELLPGIGDATAGDEFGRAVAKGDYGTAALNAVGTVPILGDMAIFAGALAKNADLGALRKAKMLEDTGADRDEIWKETGWVNDKGDWKFEISDDLSVAKPSDQWGWANQQDYKGGSSVSGNVGEFIEHKGLTDAYDGVTDFGDADTRLMMRVRPDGGGGGSFDPESGSISVGDVTRLDGGKSANKSVALHELQHAIQEREGFARGGNPGMFAGNKSIYDLKESQRKEFEDSYGYTQKFDYELLRNEPELYKKLLKDGQEKLSSKPFYEEFAKRNLPEGDRVWFAKRMDSMDTELNELRREAMKDPQEQYVRLAGEAEARNVQKRMDWTPEQRRATPPWKSLDVPEDELIYRKSGGVANSVERP
jgi:hypothetical protein